MLTNSPSLIASVLGAAALAGCLSTDAPPDPEPTPFMSSLSLGRVGGGGSVAPTMPAPALDALWRTDHSVGFSWTDKSNDESGFLFEIQQPDGSWKVWKRFDPVDSSYSYFPYTKGGLDSNTSYCFRMTAYRDSDRAVSSSPKVCTRTASVATCSEDTLKELVALAPAISDPKNPCETISYVNIDCNVFLGPGVVITKQMRITGKNAHDLVIDLNHGTLDGDASGANDAKCDMLWVNSKTDGTYDADGFPHYMRPKNVTIENGVVRGSIRLWGISQGAWGDVYKRSSATWEHASRAQRDAPTNIVLDNMQIIGHSRIPLYFGPGVTNSKLINSRISGHSGNASIYLGAETRGNVIKNNDFDTQTDDAQINIDSSSYNKIIDNVFTHLDNGGLFLYRNCGEQGVARHQTPSYNQIINNQFIYSTSDPFFVGRTVLLGSRDGHSPGSDYCGYDSYIPYGSGYSDLDYARYNVVMQNQIYLNPVDLMIKTNRPTVYTPNYIDYNTTVSPDTAVTRKAGCYVSDGSVDFIVDGTPYSVDGCLGHCDDGTLVSCPSVPGSGDPGVGS